MDTIWTKLIMITNDIKYLSLRVITPARFLSLSSKSSANSCRCASLNAFIISGYCSSDGVLSFQSINICNVPSQVTAAYFMLVAMKRSILTSENPSALPKYSGFCHWNLFA